MECTPYSLARRYVGHREIAGPNSDPTVLSWLKRVAPWAADDEIPWCGAFIYHWAWLLDLERPALNKASARAWLGVGQEIPLSDAMPGSDIVIFMRGYLPQPGPEVLSAPGHVGFFAGRNGVKRATDILILGGNQSDMVSITNFPADLVLGVRRLRYRSEVGARGQHA